MAVILVPAGIWTGTGRVLLVPVPSPSWPSPLFPQASTLPVLVRARVKSQPARADVTLAVIGSSTSTGTSLFVVVPSPSWPSRLSPQATSPPAAAAAGRTVLPPARAAAAAGPAGNDAM